MKVILKLVSIQKWPFFAISASISGIPCATYHMYVSAQSLDFPRSNLRLDLAEKCLISDLETASAH
jgi:hypothetical protein